MAGMRRKSKTRRPSANKRPTVIPVISGWLKASHGMIVPIYMKPPKFRMTSTQLLTSSWRFSVSSRNCPFQFKAFPATKHASKSSVPSIPHTPMVKSFSMVNIIHIVVTLPQNLYLLRAPSAIGEGFHCRPIFCKNKLAFLLSFLY